METVVVRLGSYLMFLFLKKANLKEFLAGVATSIVASPSYRLGGTSTTMLHLLVAILVHQSIMHCIALPHFDHRLQVGIPNDWKETSPQTWCARCLPASALLRRRSSVMVSQPINETPSLLDVNKHRQCIVVGGGGGFVHVLFMNVVVVLFFLQRSNDIWTC